MKVAVFGHSLFHLAVGLRENLANEVKFFVDSATLPITLKDEPALDDQTFVQAAPWVTYREILRPRTAEITRCLADFDVALVTDLGPIFAESARTDFVFIPGGSDFTQYPFPFRSRSMRPRGRQDAFSVLVAARLRPAIRSALGIWGSGPFSPWVLAASRLGLSLDKFLPRAFDTDLFAPGVERLDGTGESESITVFHPTRVSFGTDPHLAEIGGCKGNDLLFRGFAEAVRQGADVRLVLINRDGSPDQKVAEKLLTDLGLGKRVEWLRAGNSAGFTWLELVDIYRSCDIVVSDFAGWTGMVNVEGAACGKPVVGNLEPKAMEYMYPDGNPHVQAADAEEVCDAIMMLTDPGRRLSIGSASRQWALDHHDLSVVARRCETMLATLGLPR